ncbi:hypothetical protein [Azotobacter beijerinckii]|uniref:Uncharacterized protein n=1 Tax=Azotobacter beijerinckii TaxID=170623 RepID=A0A1I4F8Z2_9GAMM|nr:hypothetical protein [Azotobacter beijerinckii]SFB42814.1 hypothetical protein SAMN04244571_02754 [Azotobacter beijerinckii]SFL13317.1 hypothetical protein SAMN04244574_03243 [Azotobacter beijerinckii]
MGLTLDQFADEIRRDIEAFVADYRKKHEENPEHYPLELPDNNAGLWSEFFMDFHLHGKAQD